MQVQTLCTVVLALVISIGAHTMGYAETRSLTDAEQAQVEIERLEEQAFWESLKAGIARLEEQQKQLQEWLREGLVRLDQGQRQLQALHERIARLEVQPLPRGETPLPGQTSVTDEAHIQAHQPRKPVEQKPLASFPSPFAAPEAVSAPFPPVCSVQLQDKKAKLEQDGYSREAWFSHIFECEECCSPLLSDIMDVHTSHVVEQPHTIVFLIPMRINLRQNINRSSMHLCKTLKRHMTKYY